MVVHICCSVDSHYFLQRLRKDYPKERIIGFFYNPNIHPYSEYLLRYQDVKRSCKKLKIELFDGNYDYEAWLLGAKGLENEPEKGARCEFCFDIRVQKSVEFAKKIGENIITTTLLMSPKKQLKQLKKSLESIVKDNGLEYIFVDYRKDGGTNEQFQLAKKDMLYHQNYCGCLYALQVQRGEGRAYELMSCAYGQIWPNSAQDRTNLYQKVMKFEKKGIKFRLIKDQFMNYRLLFCLVKFNDVAIQSFILYKSHFKKELSKFEIQNEKEIYFTDKNEIKIVSLQYFNKLAKSTFKSMNELLQNPPSLSKQSKIRAKICAQDSQSPIIVVEKIRCSKVNIRGVSNIYIDVREILVRI